MTNHQIEVAKIIAETALQTLADKHGTTVELIKLAIAAGQEVVTAQMHKLIKAGIEAAATA